MEHTTVQIRDYRELLRHGADAFGALVFLQSDQETVTFSDFADLVCRAARGMRTYPEGIVLCRFSRQKLFAVGYFAAILTGHTACLLPDGHEVPDTLAREPAIGDDLLEQWLSLEPLELSELCPPEPEAPCTIAFSSGTLSAAKGVVLSQKNLLTDTQYGMRRHRYWEGERLVHILPYWHLFGLVTELLAPLHAGVSVFLPRSPMHFLPALRGFRPHSLHIPPALAEVLCTALRSAADPAEVTGGALEKIMCAGAPLREETAATLLRYGILPCTAYGLTECSPCVSMTAESDIRIGTSGPPLDCVRVVIAEDGEILVQGPTVMLGYFGDEPATEQRLRDGYLHTGDLGKLDEAGHLCILGRKSSMLVFANGKKCIPELIEQRISGLAGISECQLTCRESAAGSVPELWVVTERSEAGLRPEIDAVMGQAELEPYLLTLRKEPLPKNALGKVLR